LVILDFIGLCKLLYVAVFLFLEKTLQTLTKQQKV